MRNLRKTGEGRWHAVVERQIRFSKHKIRRRTEDPARGLMFRGEQVNHATMD
jgi:hypothetical protein